MVPLRGQRAYIGDVQHKTVLKVTEEGTLAAAATSVGVGATAMPVSTFTMTVDRPFFCVIREEAQGIPLFAAGLLYARRDRFPPGTHPGRGKNRF